MTTTRQRCHKPSWLKKNLPTGREYEKVRKLLSRSRLHTVCQEARCPNMWECFSNNTATFMILGSECTRNCRFCNITPGTPPPPDPDEPRRVAKAALDLGLKYVVVTSVTRDDLEDGGAEHFAETITEIKQLPGGIRVEVLIPDFQGSHGALKTVLDAGPDVLNHNIETIPALYPKARPEADYQRSLDLLKKVAEITPSIPAKSGIMVGLGENFDEIKVTLNDLFDHGCTILTMGQYLQPSRNHLIPGHGPEIGRFPGDFSGKAAALDVEPPDLVEHQGTYKNSYQKSADNGGPRQPDPAYQTEPQEQFQPGQDQGHNIDEPVGKNLIVENHLGKSPGMEYLVVTGKEKHPSQKKTKPVKNNQVSLRNALPLWDFTAKVLSGLRFSVKSLLFHLAASTGRLFFVQRDQPSTRTLTLENPISMRKRARSRRAASKDIIRFSPLWVFIRAPADQSPRYGRGDLLTELKAIPRRIAMATSRTI